MLLPDTTMNEHPLHGQYAGVVSRFIAFSIDMLVVSLISFLATAFLGLVSSFFGLDTTRVTVIGGQLFNGLQQLILLSGALFTWLFGLVYFLFFWVLTGATPGKRLLGLRVVRLDGQPLTIGPALLRYVGYWLSLAILFLGYAWIIIDKRRQGWHDKLARTVVIYDRQPFYRP